MSEEYVLPDLTAPSHMFILDLDSYIDFICFAERGIMKRSETLSIVNDSRDLFSKILEKSQEFSEDEGMQAIYLGGCIAAIAAILLAPLDEEAEKAFLSQMILLKGYFKREKEYNENGE